MSDSYRLTVLKALTTLLEGIKVADGYNYDMEGKVYRGRLRFGDADPTVVLSILEAPRQPMNRKDFVGNNDFYKQNLELLLQGWAEDDKIHPSDPVYKLLDDVEKKIHELTAINANTGLPISPNYLLGGLLADVQHQGGSVRPPTDGVSMRCFLYWPITLVISNVFTN